MRKFFAEKRLFEQKWNFKYFLVLLVSKRFSQVGLKFLVNSWSQSNRNFCSPIRKRSRYISLTISGDTGIMIFGNRNGKAGEKCNRLGSNEYECQVKQKKKVLLAIPRVQSASAPSLIITETGEFVKIFTLLWQIQMYNIYAYDNLGIVTTHQIESKLNSEYFIQNGCTATFQNRMLIFGLHQPGVSPNGYDRVSS